MKPVEGLPLQKGYSRVMFAKDQPEYLPLPAQKNREGVVITEWQLSMRERLKIAFGSHLYLKVLTFNKPLQPVKLGIVEDK